jgi:hypothetical protein
MPHNDDTRQEEALYNAGLLRRRGALGSGGNDADFVDLPEDGLAVAKQALAALRSAAGYEEKSNAANALRAFIARAEGRALPDRS